MPEFSFIIPHHNAPSLLRRCLQSIPARDDVQVIVVDDKSNDKYVPALKELETVFPSCEFVYLENNGGGGHARNVGIDHARGRWILFADADDFFYKDLPDILDTYRDAPQDILYFRHLSVQSDNIEQSAERDTWINGLYDRYVREQDEKLIRCNHCYPWGKMIRKSLVDRYHIRFDEVPFSNDVMFGVTSGCKAETVQIINRTLYVLTERTGSLTAKFGTKPKELETRAAVCFRSHDFIRSLGDSYVSVFQVPPPPAYYIARMFVSDKKLFAEYFRRIPEVYPSYPVAVKQMRLCLDNRLDKVKLYLYSFWTYLRQNTFRIPKNA